MILSSMLRKLSLAVLLFAVVVPAQQKPVVKLHEPITCPSSKPPFTTGELEDIYTTYNRMYWDGKLPPAKIIWTGLPEGRFGETMEESKGHFLIKLDVVKNVEVNVAKTTILHEMAHVKVWGEECHIPGTPNKCTRWLVEIHRIMLEGAFDDLV